MCRTSCSCEEGQLYERETVGHNKIAPRDAAAYVLIAANCFKRRQYTCVVFLLIATADPSFSIAYASLTVAGLVVVVV